MTTIRLRKDNSGQVSIDFLLGVTIFLLAFIFLISAIPSMFTPFQSNSDELTMMADRIAATLVEDTLAYQSTPTGPIMTSIIKYDVSGNPTDYKNYNNWETKGAKFSIGGKTLFERVGLASDTYHIQIVLEEESGSSYTINDGSEPGNSNVGQSRRFVLVRHEAAGDSTQYPGTKAILMVRVW